MKKLFTAAVLFPGLLFLHASVVAQCSGTCPTGSLTTLPTGSASTTITIPAGTTYCITGPLTSAATYTINGTLIVSSGVVSIGSVNMSNTGVIDVESNAQLTLTGTTNSTGAAPAAAFSNINVCSYGFLNMIGSFNQGEINVALANNSDFLVQGSWSSSASDEFIKLGAAALIEVCGTLYAPKNGWLTETSTSVSYLFMDGSGGFNGWISASEGASMIDWTDEGGEGGADYPAARSCISCGNLALAPPGAVAGTCGATAANYFNDVLGVSLVDFYEAVQGQDLLVSADLAKGPQMPQATLESSADGRNFYPDAYEPVQSNAGDLVHYVFALPVQQGDLFYRLKMEEGPDSSFSWVLPPVENPSSPATAVVFPNPASDVIYIRLPAGSRYAAVSVYDNTGRSVLRQGIPLSSGLMQLNLPRGLPQGIYMVALSGTGTSPWVTKVAITGGL